LFREADGDVEVFLVHPGGPLWAKKDKGAWSIPKGECEEGEDPFAVALREFSEETGVSAEAAMRVGGDCDIAAPVRLDPVRQPGGKLVYAWAARGDVDAAAIKSNDFVMEWPPRSGRHVAFPEVDRAGWFELEEAAVKILKGQLPLLKQLGEMLAAA
jgi:predicted NUDIX family NTP pyrophosphohydrolase